MTFIDCCKIRLRNYKLNHSDLLFLVTNATEAEAPRVTNKGKNGKLSPVFGLSPLLFEEELLLVVVVVLFVVVCLDVVVDGLVVLDDVVLLFVLALFEFVLVEVVVVVVVVVVVSLLLEVVESVVDDVVIVVLVVVVVVVDSDVVVVVVSVVVVGGSVFSAFTEILAVATGLASCEICVSPSLFISVTSTAKVDSPSLIAVKSKSKER